MKFKVFYLISVFLSVVLNILIVSAAIGDYSCNPTIKIVNQDPNPAIPDSYVKVVLEVSDLAYCRGFAMKLDSQYPFSLDPGYDSIQTLDQTPYVSNYKNTWDVPYSIRVAGDALEGDYFLNVVYHEGNSRNFESYSIKKTLNISIVDAQTDFAPVVQEYSNSQISLGIVNTGKNTANSMIVSIPQQDSFMLTGTSQQIVGNLAAGDYTIVSFQISPRFSRNSSTGRDYLIQQNMSDISKQSSSLKVNIDYTDGIGERRTVTKEVELSSNLIAGNSTRTFGGGNFSRSSSNGNSISIWWYVAIVIFLIIAFFVYRKYKHNIMKIFKKDFLKKNSSNTPDWVLSERTKNRK